MICAKHVTCPETTLPETIQCIAEPEGRVLVVLRCSRFDPPEAIACSSNCLDGMDCRTERLPGPDVQHR